MWIFSKYGFYSVTVNDAKQDLLQVRARAREDLENLLKLTTDIVWDKESLPEIIETPKADYRWRLIIPRIAWSEIQELILENLDYSNFKNQIKDNRRHALYSSVWSIMLRLQEQSRVDENQMQLWNRWYKDENDDLDDEIAKESEFMSLLDTEEQEERLSETGYQVVDGDKLDTDLDDPTDPFYDPTRL